MGQFVVCRSAVSKSAVLPYVSEAKMEKPR